MRRLGLAGARSNTKFIPEDYLFNSRDVRLAVLQGLLDSDGGPVTQHGRTCRIQFTTVSNRLRDDVVFLVQSLGGVVYQRTRPAEGRKPGLARGRDVHHRSDAHTLDIRLPRASSHSGSPARPPNTTRPAAAGRCVSSTASSPQEPRRPCVFGSQRPTRSTSPKISCLPTTPSTTLSSFSTRRRTPRPSR
nr:LAGLIDADG family homing endonuclease [Mycobacterium kyorinense]